MSESERRRFHRFPFNASCRLGVSGQPIDCDLLDLSINGVLLKLHVEPGLGLSFDGELSLRLTGEQDGQEIDLKGTVRAVRVHADLLACHFTGMPASSFEQLKGLVEANLGDASLLDRELTQLDYWPGLVAEA
ncbi:PilZ domain-containing protein [Wenzhouxiangella marina]|uniref:Uncharacterized protein n=1 Tax=Wenzhouxiangella marina TaxID=1579979 RepID=A0A0K0XZ64_9GAMM|nr:PilZ domain-containing protein [Wenzhouxiangella marina]AKS42922.1 hypothetical protein WM2015_2564 [Wenzhouxiangella marina]MBB6087395.1 hypothetical protein [Wenzhouxiangella marina]